MLHKVQLGFLLFFTVWGLQAQNTNFKVGVYGGLPMGNSTPYYKYQFGIDGIYLSELSRSFHFGFATGLSYAVGDYFYKKYDDVVEEFQVANFAFMPLAASGRFILGNFFVGADVGYAVSITGKKAFTPNGGFYFRPKIGYDFDVLGFYVSSSHVFAKRPNPTDYFNIQHGNGFNAINLGVEYHF